MRRLFVRIIAWLYRSLKSSSFFSSVYYSIANTQYFENLQVQELMLADKQRVNTYRAAIQKHIKPGDRVVDLGTGTGILSFLAAQRHPTRIYAIEHSPVIELAKTVSNANGFACIEFANVMSRDFSVSERVDVLLHEQMGAYCFDERMVENLIDLRQRVLKPGGKILPNGFRWFIEPVMLKPDRVVPFVWEQEIHGIRFDSLRERAGAYGAAYQVRLLQRDTIEKLLAKPAPAMVADMETIQMADLPRSLRIRRTIRERGRIDGFCSYFETWFDDDISFTTEPGKSTLHWSIPLFRTEGVIVEPGDEVELHLQMDDIADPMNYRWSWTHKVAATKSCREYSNAVQ